MRAITVLMAAMVLSIAPASEKERRDFGWIESGAVIPQVAIGDNRWSMEFIVMSLEETTQVFTVTFRNGAGELMSVPLEGLGNNSVWADSVPQGGVRRVRTSNTGPLRQGYAVMEVSGNITGSNLAFYAVLTSSEPAGTRPPFRTFVPGMDDLESRQRLFFNNTEGNVTCAAVVGKQFLSFEDPIRIIARDTNGAELQRTTLGTLDRNQHTAFCLPDLIPVTAGRRGILDILGDGGIIGFTFDPDGKFHTEAPYSYCCFDVP